MRRGIKLRHLVENFRAILKRDKSVSKPLRDVKHFMIFHAQHYAHMVFESRRLRSQIYDRIVDRAPRTSYQLHLGKRCYLIVHSAKGAFLPANRNIALDQPRIEALRFELSATPAPSEKSAVVFRFLWVYDKGSLQLCWGENHEYGSLLSANS